MRVGFTEGVIEPHEQRFLWVALGSRCLKCSIEILIAGLKPRANQVLRSRNIGMKIELRIPATEQYAYIGLELADNEVLTDEMIHDAVSNYRRATSLLRGTTGLPPKEWNAALDEYRKSGKLKNGVELYEKMSDHQKDVLQELKRSFNRDK